MKTSYVWRNCYIKELKIPDIWKSSDAYSVEPKRQDVFWVECDKEEAIEDVLPLIRDKEHHYKTKDSIVNSTARSFHFLISRNEQYVQYYPWLTLNTPGNLWEKFTQVTFISLSQLVNVSARY